jgi:hypothetical protein
MLNNIGFLDSIFFAGDFLGDDVSQIYAIEFLGNMLVSVDPLTAAVTPIGPATPIYGEDWTGLAGDSTQDILYGSSTDGSRSTLYTIDETTGVATPVGQITNAPCIIGIAANGVGELYGLDIVTDALLRIDKTTAAGTVVGPVGFDANYAQGMDFDEATGTLYLAAYNYDPVSETGTGELRIANTSTGNTTLVGYFPESSEIDALSIPTSSSNTSPTISGLPDQGVSMNGTANNAIDLWAYAQDPESTDSDLTFTIDNTPDASAGVSIDSNRYIDIFPATDWTGETDVVIRVTDPGGLYDTDAFSVTVASGNTAPTITSLPDQQVPMNGTANNAIDLWAYAQDPESTDSDLTFTIDNTPDASAGVSIDSNRYISIFPATDWTGETDVVIRVTDPGGLYDTDAFSVTVASGNTAPTITNLPDQGVPMNGTANNAIDLWAYAQDPESTDSDLTFTIDNTPDASAGVSIDSNRYIDIFPATDWTGETDVVIRVTDPGGLYDMDAFSVTVTGGSMNVSVAISGNRLCPGRTFGVNRCFSIRPDSPLNATVRFYFSEAERGGYSLDDLLAFRSDGDWVEEPGPYTHGGTGDAQYVQVQNVQNIVYVEPIATRFALGTSGSSLYLPLVAKRWPPIPYTPALHAISNPHGINDYTVSWSSVDLVDSYTLEEDDNPAFSTPLPVYDGLSTFHTVSDQPVGTWYYRVRACNVYGCSGWSNEESVTVLPPPNLIQNGDFEAGRPPTPWIEYSSVGRDVVVQAGGFGPSWGALLGYNDDSWEYIEQSFAVPAGTPGADLSFHWKVASNDDETEAWDYFTVTLRDASGNWLQTLMTADNTDTRDVWFYPTIAVDLSQYGGQTLRLRMESELDESYFTVFVVDDVALWSWP